MWIRMSFVSELLGGLAARLRREDGQTMAEYALLLTLIVVVTVAVVAALGGSISGVFTSVTGSL
jgi:Flp pilus assembly pilin Flp